MSTFLVSPGRSGGKHDNEAIRLPTDVGRWINIVDTNDVLGFNVGAVFTAAGASSVADCFHDTGVAVHAAYGGQFRWLRFYKRMARGLKA